jgi:hypothetical protein
VDRRADRGPADELIEMKRYALSLAAALALVVASGCSRADLMRSELEASASSAILSGNDQRGLVGSELPDPLVVQVLDASGRPVARQPVNFVVTAGGGSVYVGMAITDAKGLAREWWTLGSSPGTNTIEVRALDRISSKPLVLGRFYATAFSHIPEE